jgi:hypothetical protein
VPDIVVDSLPDDRGYDNLRRQHKPGGIIADVDPERLRRVREYERAMIEGEGELKALSNETGGHIWLPESFEEMIANGAATARQIDSGCVVSYRPKLPLSSTAAGELRRIEVVSRRVGLDVVSRRHCLINPVRPPEIF